MFALLYTLEGYGKATRPADDTTFYADSAAGQTEGFNTVGKVSAKKEQRNMAKQFKKATNGDINRAF